MLTKKIKNQLEEQFKITGLKFEEYITKSGNFDWSKLVDYLVLKRRANINTFESLFQLGKTLDQKAFYNGLNSKRAYDSSEPTPLLWAVLKNRIKLVKFLANFAELGQKNNKGETPLHTASSIDSFDVYFDSRTP